MDPVLTDALREACCSLPLFPLPGVVFLPSTLLPLHVFEPRYRQLVADILAGDGMFGVPLLREGWQQDYEGRPPVYPICGAGRVVRSQTLPDGRYNLLALGVGRVRIEAEIPSDKPYRLVRATLLDDTQAPPELLHGAVESMKLLAGQAMSAQPELAQDLSRAVNNARDPQQMLSALAHLSLREVEERQRYLETENLSARADLVISALANLLASDGSAEA